MRSFHVAVAFIAVALALTTDVALAEIRDWQLALVTGGFSRHYRVEPGEKERLNENQRTFGIEASAPSGLIATASYYKDSFDGDSAYLGFGRVWTKRFELGPRAPDLRIGGGVIGAVTYRRMYAWWRYHDTRPASADEMRVIPFVAPVLRLSLGRVSTSTMVLPKIDFGGKMYTDFGVVYTQISVAVR